VGTGTYSYRDVPVLVLMSIYGHTHGFTCQILTEYFFIKNYLEKESLLLYVYADMPVVKRKRSSGGSSSKRRSYGRPSRTRTALKRARMGAGFGYRKSGYGSRRRAEVKYVDLAAANYSLDTTGNTTLIPVVAVGADETNRIGRNITLKSIQMHGRIFNNSTAVFNHVLIALVYDRQPNKALASFTDIYDSASPNAFKKDENKDRFLIIKEWRKVLTGSGVAANNSFAWPMEKYLKLKGLPVNYSSLGTGAIGDINTGALLLVYTGNNADGTADAQLTAGFRVRFQDA